MNTLKFLIQKEFLQIRRNAFLPRLIIIFPIVIMSVMPWVMNMEVKHIDVVVVDNDHSPTSQRLVQSIAHNAYFQFQGQKPTYQEGLAMIERSETDVVVVIPPHYGRDILRRQQPQLLIAANAVNSTKGSLGGTYLSQMVTMQVQPEAQAIAEQIRTLYLFNEHFDFKRFMIPALFGIMMMMMTGYLPVLNIVGEKEAGTISQINVTPVRKWAFILAKLIPYWLIALFVVTVCLLLAWAVYGIVPVGEVWLVYLLAMLLAFFFSGFGLLISNYSDTMQQAVFVMWFFVVILMLLSGLFTPTRSMPEWAYLTTYINPMSYFIDGIRTVFIRGGGWSSVYYQVLALAAIAATVGGWAVLSYRKNS